MKPQTGLRTLLAALAILLSPGVIGPWLDLAHACPAAEASTRTASSSMAGHQGHHQGMDHKSGHREQCHCVGTCHVAALPAARGTPVLTVAVVAPTGSGLHLIAATDLTTPSHTLPFAHAPPALS